MTFAVMGEKSSSSKRKHAPVRGMPMLGFSLILVGHPLPSVDVDLLYGGEGSLASRWAMELDVATHAQEKHPAKLYIFKFI